MCKTCLYIYIERDSKRILPTRHVFSYLLNVRMEQMIYSCQIISSLNPKKKKKYQISKQQSLNVLMSNWLNENVLHIKPIEWYDLCPLSGPDMLFSIFFFFCKINIIHGTIFFF